MPTEHSTIADPDIHEPKGAASATSNQVYVADGGGSGTWTDLTKYYALTIELDDISTSSSSYVAVPYNGTVTKVTAVLHDTIATADATLTSKINGTDITTGSLTVAFSGSAGGDVDETTPTAANTVVAGDYLEVATDGASTNAVRSTITFLISYTT
jgi:hypothetical protein